jgi:hypothetical protein
MGASEFTCMAMNDEFIAAVLEGMENMLEELIERVLTRHAHDLLGALIEHTAIVRRSFEQRVSGGGD